MQRATNVRVRKKDHERIPFSKQIKTETLRVFGKTTSKNPPVFGIASNGYVATYPQAASRPACPGDPDPIATGSAGGER